MTRRLPAKTTSPTSATITVEIQTSPFGSLSPTLTIKAPHASNWRKVTAALHRAAAAVLEATADAEKWCVTVDNYGDYEGCVRLETLTGQMPEAKRGEAVLLKVAKNAIR